MDEPIIWIIAAIVILLVVREIMLWYWRVNDIIKNQEAQLDLMDMIIGEMSIQNKLLQRLVKENETSNNSKKETENEESTP